MSGGTIQLGRGGLTPAVRALLIANGAAYALTLLYVFWIAPDAELGRLEVVAYLGLWWPGLEQGYVWQPLTYMFVHDLDGPTHILFNMFVLWSFGALFEPVWGARRFLGFYFACGLGGAALSILASVLFPSVSMFQGPIVGASAAVLGFVIAFGVTFPDRYVFLFFMVPVRGRYLALGLVAADVLMNFFGYDIASQAHLGGMLTAFLLLTGYWRPDRLRGLWGDLEKKRRHQKLRKRFMDAVRDKDRDD